MMAVRVIKQKKKRKHKLKVAAYARISVDCEQLSKSLRAQRSYFEKLINSNSDYKMVNVYVDQGISGTSIDRREAFKDMMRDARAGKIDLILTKSISRFARNTVDLLNAIRELKNLGVEVKFEREGISTMAGEGELVLTLLGTFAQAEAESISDNVKWSRRKNFSKGIDQYRPMFGYDYDGKEYKINIGEANLIKYVFKRFNDGISYTDIAHEVNSKKFENKDKKLISISTRNNKPFNQLSIKDILRQTKYMGVSVLQKKFVANPVTHYTVRNKGELPMYEVEGTHPVIIKSDVFMKAQERINFIHDNKSKCHKQSSWYTGLVKCPICGKSYIKINNRYFRCIGNGKYRTCENMERFSIDDLENAVKGVDLKNVDHIAFKRIRTHRFSRKGHGPGDNRFYKIDKGDFEIIWKQ